MIVSSEKVQDLYYKNGTEGTILLDINNKDIFVSRNLIHHEHIFPYQYISSPTTWTYHTKFGHSTPPEHTNFDQTNHTTPIGHSPCLN